MIDDTQNWASVEVDLRRYVARKVPPAEVDDVVQDVLLRLVSAKDTLDPDKPIGPWIQTVARNAVIDRHRKRVPTPPAPEEEPNLEGQTIDAQIRSQRAFVGGWLRDTVADLPDTYREAVHRVDVLGEPQAEVADALGVPYSTLKSRVQRGRAKVRDAFFRCCEAELDARGSLEAVRRLDADCPCCDD